MFALNGNPENPCCTGIDSVIEAYRSAVKVVQLSQPTCVAPLIDHVASLAEQVMQHPIKQVNGSNQGKKQTLSSRQDVGSIAILQTSHVTTSPNATIMKLQKLIFCLTHTFTSVANIAILCFTDTDCWHIL